MADDIKDLQDGSQIQKEYKEGLAYKERMKFTKNWPEYERFKAGDQWPMATDRTKNLPRPVFNIIRYIENHKVSSVMNENVKMVFSPQEDITADEVENPEVASIYKEAQEAADKFTRFSDSTWERIKQDELNEEALESASNLGTGIWHYYWDNNKNGGSILPYIGEMCGETIDPMNIFFGNPQQKDVQKQPYIIISYRDQVDTIRKEAEGNKVAKEKIAMITSDKEVNNEGYDSAKIEVNDSEKATVLLKYWKEKDEIHFAKVCSSVMIKPKTPTGFNRYPIAVMQWERRKKSIFGVGDTEGLIPNQKGINFLMAMQLLAVQLTGWPKLVYKTGSVDLNKIMNNDPSMPVEDRSPPGHDGVKYLMPGSVSGLAQGLVESFMEHTKSLSSAQDASTGDIGKGDMNASAIMLLQKAAGVPIESIKKRFYRVQEDNGRIWEQFWKVKYNTTRRITLKDDNETPYAADFNGSDYKAVDLNLKIDIGPSSSYSEELMMASLDKLFDKKAIGIVDYLENAPKNVIPFKDRLLKKIKAAEEEQAAMMAQQPQVDPMQQMQMQAEQEAATKQQDHQQKLELEQVKGNNQLQVAAMKQKAGG